jgi:hypothetical protein
MGHLEEEYRLLQQEKQELITVIAELNIEKEQNKLSESNRETIGYELGN